MTNLLFDGDRRKYFILDEGEIDKKYISCGTKVNVISFGEIKTGIVEYAKTVNKGYYLMLDNGNYIPMFAVQQLEIV